MQNLWSASELEAVKNFYALAQIGSVKTVQHGLQQLAERLAVDEFIFTCDIYDMQKRLDNFQYLMQMK